jgi:transcriptional regulator with XRE-family HTH domain
MAEIVQLRPGQEDAAAREIAEWLRRTQAQVDMSFSAWARKAGISDTSVTRFLRHGSPVPKVATLEALARAAGVPLPHRAGLSSEVLPYVDIPVMNPAIASIGGWEAARMRAVEQTRAPVKYADCGAFKLTVDTGSRLGFNPGDLIIVDPRRVVSDGSTVVVCLADGGCGVMRYERGSLIPCGTVVVDVDDARILGVAVLMQREIA